ncbi:MAG: type II toxin-antitoxin system Phd/YefM family antitoxin [Atopobiaceae bacterium]|nr:type II toxin-antitoxin system Phd/YefM family antitoxin [Atopobiaceae bacterium]
MTHIKTSSDLQRNIGAIYDLCDRTKEPVYVTRNGKSSLVVINADSFDDILARQAELEEELELYRTLMQSELDRLKGDTFAWEDVQRERMSMEPGVA